MSSKVKRKRQAQRLQRELAASTLSHKICAEALRTTSQGLASEEHRSKHLASQVSNLQQNYERELARYKFIDDMLKDAVDDMRYHAASRHLAPLDYMLGTVRVVQKDYPYLEVIQVPDISDAIDVARGKEKFNEAAFHVLRQYVFEVLSEDRQRRYRDRPQAPECGITIAFDGDKYRTFMLPGYLLNVDEKTALNILRREIVPMFLREYRNMQQGVCRGNIKF